MLLLYSSRGSVAGITSLAEQGKAQGKHNVTFVCLFLLGQLDECVDLLIECGRLPEATFFARTYLPSRCVWLFWHCGLWLCCRGRFLEGGCGCAC